MSIVTPRGLKIVLPVHWAFALMARVWRADPQRDAFRVLKTCEGLECIPSTLAFLGGLLAVFWPGWPTWAIFIGVVGGKLLGIFMTQTELFQLVRPWGLLFLGTLWSYVSGFGLFHLPASLVILKVIGWDGVAWWIGAHMISYVVGEIIQIFFMKRKYHIWNRAVSYSEWNFLIAYVIHAAQLGLDKDTSVKGQEFDLGYWKECLDDFARKCPTVVARFRLDEEEQEMIRQTYVVAT